MFLFDAVSVGRRARKLRPTVVVFGQLANAYLCHNKGALYCTCGNSGVSLIESSLRVLIAHTRTR